MTGGFPSQRDSNVKSVFIPWHCHASWKFSFWLLGFCLFRPLCVNSWRPSLCMHQCINRMRILTHYTPAPPKVERGYTGFTLMSVRPSVRPSVCPSVCPSVGKVSATFRENYWLNSFHPWDLYLWGKSLDPYWFSCSCPHFWPSGGQKLTENRGFRNFSRKLSARFISSLGFILMG